MICRNCNKNINDTALYCTYCGHKQTESEAKGSGLSFSSGFNIASVIKTARMNKLAVIITCSCLVLVLIAGIFFYSYTSKIHIPHNGLNAKYTEMLDEDQQEALDNYVRLLAKAYNTRNKGNKQVLNKTEAFYKAGKKLSRLGYDKVGTAISSDFILCNLDVLREIPDPSGKYKKAKYSDLEKYCKRLINEIIDEYYK